MITALLMVCVRGTAPIDVEPWQEPPEGKGGLI